MNSESNNSPATKPPYIAQLWQGDISLKKAFWVYLISGTLGLVILFKLIALGMKYIPIHYYIWKIYPPLAGAICITYSLFALRILWSSANRSNARSSKLIRVLIVCIILIVANSLIYNVLKNKGYWVDEVTITGDITVNSYVQFKKIFDKSIVTPKKILIDSGGGDALAALAIAKIIQQHRINVEVNSLCASSCANYIFIAGNEKIIGPSAIIMFHGGPTQENMMQLSREAETFLTINKIETVKTFGEINKEGTIKLMPPNTAESNSFHQTQQFIGLTETSSLSEHIQQLQMATQDFYSSLDVDEKIMTIGQTGNYQHIYESKKYDGFYYSPNDMKKLGIQNITIKDGVWNPEKNPAFHRFYQVKLEPK
jgi:ATP-dependent protease ClpP protease subunit